MGLRDRADQLDNPGSAPTGSASGKKKGLLQRARQVNRSLTGGRTGGSLRQRAAAFRNSSVGQQKKKQEPSVAGDALEQVQSKLDRKLLDLTNLFEITKEINATLDVDALLTILLFTCMGQMGTQRVAVMTDVSGLFAVRTQRGFAELQDTKPLSADDPLAVLLSEDEQPVGLEDLADTDISVPGEWRENGVALIVPLSNQGTPVGILLLGERSSGQQYSEEDRNYLSTLASLAAIALENARLYSSLEQKLNQLSALYNISRVINSSSDPDEVVALAAETLSTGFKLDQFFLAGFSAADEQFHLLFEKGFAGQIADRFPFAKDEPLLRFPLDLQEPLDVENCGEDSNALSLLGEEGAAGIDRLLLVPFIAGGRNVGVLGVGSVQGRPEQPWSREEKELFSIISSQTAPPLLMAAMLEENRHNIADPFQNFYRILQTGWDQAVEFDLPMSVVELRIHCSESDMVPEALLSLFKKAGQAVRESVDPRYSTLRTGISSFAVVLPGMERDAADEAVAAAVEGLEKLLAAESVAGTVIKNTVQLPGSYDGPVEYLLARDTAKDE